MEEILCIIFKLKKNVNADTLIKDQNIKMSHFKIFLESVKNLLVTQIFTKGSIKYDF